ncbi:MULTISPECIES: HipA family kinase [Rhodanobacteraceae]|uniref:HipA family kinase n=1 Tax=Rhodanobacteraceae TaxID=1775411 RepID=UPI00087F80D1|nr:MULTISPECIES: HipA family kinase [Rhodanobacteraceae]SDG67799.1 hypothetical protein SAMN04515659_3319 [Dyella sp. 333MFSha]SKB39119.1 hypothetical protein SAMN05660880_00871 [Luteibacter sp. 22Crub2.1]
MPKADASLHPLGIVEIIERSVQGRTRPFLCRAEDGDLYYVKGSYAGTRSHLCEWMAGHLGRALGLPIPEFRCAIAPAALLNLHPEGADIGTRPVFASKAVEHLSELSFSAIRDVPKDTRKDILVLDWWTKNGDRTLTGDGGNPNLLWDPADRRLVAIDHNLAFDTTFSAEAYVQTHVFRDDIPTVFNDLAEKGVYAIRLAEALSNWEAAWNSAPEDWHYFDAEQTIPTDFDVDAIRLTLSQTNRDDFWRLP